MSDEYDEKIAHLEQAIVVHQDAISKYKSQILWLKVKQHVQRPSKAPEFPEVGNYPMGYRRGATGAMEARTVHVLHVTTGQESESRAFWPDKAPVEPSYSPKAQQNIEDIRIDPPYDR